MAQQASSDVGIFVMTFIVFLVLKLQGTIDWSWWWVTAPLWGGFLMLFFLLVVVEVLKGIRK